MAKIINTIALAGAVVLAPPAKGEDLPLSAITRYAQATPDKLGNSIRDMANKVNERPPGNVTPPAAQNVPGNAFRQMGLKLICKNPQEIANYIAQCNRMPAPDAQSCLNDKIAVCGPDNKSPNNGSTASPQIAAQALGPARGLTFSNVGSDGTLAAEVKSAFGRLPQYVQRIGQYSNLEIITAPTIVDGTQKLGFSFNGATEEQKATVNAAMGYHVHASVGIDHPVIIISKQYAAQLDAYGRATYERNPDPAGAIAHESAHNILNFVGEAIDSPADARGRKDYAHEADMVSRYQKDVIGLMRHMRALGESKGTNSTAYTDKVGQLETVQWMLPKDVWRHISGGTLTEKTKVSVSPDELKAGTKETLAQSLSNAYATAASPETAKMRAIFAEHFPGITEAGERINGIMESYGMSTANKAELAARIRERFRADLTSAPAAPTRNPPYTSSSPQP